MNDLPRDADILKPAIRKRAAALGFDALGFVDIPENWEAGDRLDAFLDQGRHGEMVWMGETRARRRHPRAMWPRARSALVLAINYGPTAEDEQGSPTARQGMIARYARGDDYHDVIKGRLKTLADFVASRLKAHGGEERSNRVFVDTAPLMEKPLAALAGLGWQGKHTNLVSREFGSWLLIGVILTSAEFTDEEAHGGSAVGACGTCRACLDACPTGAFPAPYELDARRCLSYLTIEFDGPWPEGFRSAMGNRIYGCDDCLAVCPWNRFASAAKEMRLTARPDLLAPALSDLAKLDDDAFRKLFARSPIKRIGRGRFVRNVLYAIGNSGDVALLAEARALRGDPDPVVADAALWACEQLARDAI